MVRDTLLIIVNFVKFAPFPRVLGLLRSHLLMASRYTAPRAGWHFGLWLCPDAAFSTVRRPAEGVHFRRPCFHSFLMPVLCRCYSGSNGEYIIPDLEEYD